MLSASTEHGKRHTRSGILVCVAQQLSERLAGALLVQAREEAGMTQKQLAQAANTSQNAVSAYENGRRQPSLPTLVRLLAAAGYEPRIRLAPLEDHDAASREWLAAQPAAFRRAWAAEQRAHTA